MFAILYTKHATKSGKSITIGKIMFKDTCNINAKGWILGK